MTRPAGTAPHRPTPTFLLQPDAERTVVVGDIQIEVAPVRVTMAGAPVHLPLKEFELLLALADHAGRVLTHDQLVHQVWGDGYQDTKGTLKTHIMRLRRTIKGQLGADYIRTVRSLGYVLEAS